MQNKTPIYCWDSNIFIAWIKDEKRSPGDMDGVLEIAERVQRNQAILITSEMLNVELVPCKMPDGAMEKIDRFFKRRNTHRLPVDSRITMLAQSIRNVHPKVTPADAVYLATAIQYKVDQFHTFDDGKSGGNSLLALNGNVAGNPLVICKPPFKQMRFPGIP